MPPIVLYLLSAALLGSIPTGYFAARLKGQGSIFLPGERSPRPAGDIYKMLGIKLGLFVTLLDFLKGVLTVTVLIQSIFGPDGHKDWRIVSAGALFVVIAHCSSPWLGFRGGRGMATTFGVFFPLLPVPATLTALLWGALSFWGLSTRPGAVASAGAMPVLSVLWVMAVDQDKLFLLYVVAFLSLWTMWEYRENLLSYMGLRKCPPPDDGSLSESDTAPKTDLPAADGKKGP